MTTTKSVYAASRINRRATKAEMEERAEFLIAYADEHGPVTVRGLYYQAEVHGVPGIDKTDHSYDKIQRQILHLRRQGRLAYESIADATRWMRKPHTHNSIEDAVAYTAQHYRRSLWRELPVYTEVWCEKDALAGVILPVTSEYDVPLMVTRGFSSETFVFEAIAARQDDQRPYLVFYLGDFDRAGHDARDSLEEKLSRFGDEFDVNVRFVELAVTQGQIRSYRLPTREPKRASASDRKWAYPFACELDAMPPDDIREIVKYALDQYLPAEKLAVLKAAEESEREFLQTWARSLAGGAHG